MHISHEKNTLMYILFRYLLEPYDIIKLSEQPTSKLIIMHIH